MEEFEAFVHVHDFLLKSGLPPAGIMSIQDFDEGRSAEMHGMLLKVEFTSEGRVTPRRNREEEVNQGGELLLARLLEYQSNLDAERRARISWTVYWPKHNRHFRISNGSIELAASA